MLIAREKKKNNIAEYILYMWQLEDMLRALKLDMEQVDRYLVAGFRRMNGLRRKFMIGMIT